EGDRDLQTSVLSLDDGQRGDDALPGGRAGDLLVLDVDIDGVKRIVVDDRLVRRGQSRGRLTGSSQLLPAPSSKGHGDIAVGSANASDGSGVRSAQQGPRTIPGRVAPSSRQDERQRHI